MKSNPSLSEEFFNNMISDFYKIEITETRLVILEAVCFKLKEMDDKLSKKGFNKVFANSKYGIDDCGVKRINLFQDINDEYINPIEYYGPEKIKNCELIKELKNILAGYNFSLTRVEYIKYISGKLLATIQTSIFNRYIDGMMFFIEDGDIITNPYYDLDKNTPIDPYSFSEYKESDFENIIEDYLFNTSKIDNISDKDLYLTKENKKNILTYMLETDYQYYNTNFVCSYLIYRYDIKEELIRDRILGYLQYENIYTPFTDKACFNEEYYKLSYKEVLFELFKSIYTLNRLKGDSKDMFKKNILSNRHLKDTFFESINILLKEPTIEGYKKVINLTL